MRNCFIGRIRFFALRIRWRALKSGDSGSRPRPRRRGCSRGERRVQRTSPNLRGSVNRSVRPPASTKSRWSCRDGTVDEGTTVSFPVMPRWMMRVPPEQRNRRYLPRRMTSCIFSPAVSDGKSSETGRRSKEFRTITRVISLPVTTGSRDNRIISTSGSSGIAVPFRVLRRKYRWKFQSEVSGPKSVDQGGVAGYSI